MAPKLAPNPNANVVELLSLNQTAKDEYESVHPPDRMGNTAAIAYGGCTLGLAANAACLTVQQGFHPYSLQGNFLGPALIDRTCHCSVTRIRDTRTFATRLVQVSQLQDHGQPRLCLTMLVDFQVQEPASLYTFSAPPTRDWASPDKALSPPDTAAELVQKGLLHPKAAQASDKSFGLGMRIFDVRHCPGSVFRERLMGIAKVPSSQDHLSITDKRSADWLRAKAPLTTEAEHVSALICAMDMAMSFILLTHDRKFLDDAGACSSLDFSFRLFTNHLNFNNWHLRELFAVTASNGRSFHDSRLWDAQGNMVATMSQQGILRPPLPKKPKI